MVECISYRRALHQRKEGVLTVRQMYRILSFFVAVFLLLGTVIPSAMAKSSKAESNLVIDRAVEVTIKKQDGEAFTNTFYLRQGVNFDKSTFEKLPKGYTLEKFVERDATEAEKERYGETLKDVSGSNGSEIHPMFVETIFDIGCLVLSINDFLDDPSWENFAWVVVDGATVALPGVPAVGSLKTIKRLIDASSILEKSLKIGVETYNTLKNFNSIWLGTASHIREAVC